MTATRISIWLCIVFLFFGCDRFSRSADGDGESVVSSDDGSKSEGASAAKGLAGKTLTIEGTDYAIEAHDDGYKLKSSDGKLKVKVEGDRVKVKDDSGKELAKVKKKDDGFKLYREGAEEAMLKGKLRGDGYKLMRKPSDEELGKIEKGSGTIGGDDVEVSGSEVKRAGKVVAEIDGVPATAAALLAATELPAAERIAMFVYAVEIGR